jgi:hypothetical protein
MKVALSLEVTDDQRRELARRLAAKSTSRLATRDEVREFVNGAIDTLSDGDATSLDNEVSAASDDGKGDVDVDGGQARRLGLRDADERELATKLQAEGKSESYIRGYLAAGRKTS